jgi:hypothetical protein
MGFHRSGWPLVGHLRVVLSAGSAAGCIPRKGKPVALGPCPFGPSLSACFGLSVLTTVQKHIRVPTHSDLAHRRFPLGSVATCFAPLASHMRWGVKPQHEGGAITSTPLGWELDDSPHPHVHPVIKDCVCLCLSSPWIDPSFERTGRSALRTVHAVLPHTALQSVVSSSGLARLPTGFMKGEKPMCREECIWPALVVLLCSTMAWAFLTLA